MLYTFIDTHRQEILDAARARIERRIAPVATYTEITNGIPLFLDQLSGSLRQFRGDTDAIVASAGRHGIDLHRMGFTVTQVVHDYGDICQAITELAEAHAAPISTDEFRILNRCLDDAIAGAVSEYARRREDVQYEASSLRLAVLAHELRNKLSAATLAHVVIKSGAVGIVGSTGAVLERSLRGMRDLIDGALAAVRIEAGQHQVVRIAVSELVEEIEADAALEATERGVSFAVPPFEALLEIRADRTILAAAVINLLHNAFKFSKLGGHVTLTIVGESGHVLFSVRDECGGLPAGASEDLFQPMVQKSHDRRGLGLGLSISRLGVERDGGTISVVDRPGHGCTFTITMPKTAEDPDEGRTSTR